MKIAGFELTGIVALSVVVGITALAMFFAYSAGNDKELRDLLDKPARDMTVGQVVCLIMFAWAIFK